jgi:hypothetical protein
MEEFSKHHQYLPLRTIRKPKGWDPPEVPEVEPPEVEPVYVRQQYHDPVEGWARDVAGALSEEWHLTDEEIGKKFKELYIRNYNAMIRVLGPGYSIMEMASRVKTSSDWVSENEGAIVQGAKRLFLERGWYELDGALFRIE